MDKYKNALKIAGVYIGLVIGAGFASGREVITFFTSYGKIWPAGMIFTGVLLSVFGWMILSIIEKENIKTYKEFLKTVMYKKTASVTEVISGLFLCVLFFAMVSASGSLLNEAFGIDRIWGSMLLSFLCFIIFRGGVEKLIGMNSLLSPLMVIGTAVVCIIKYFCETQTAVSIQGTGEKIPYMIFFSAFIYVSYNIISSVSVFVQMKSIVKDDKKSKYGALIGGGAMAFLGLMIGAVLITDKALSSEFDIPMLAVINKNFFLVNYIYILVLIGAIITTAVGNGYGAVKWIENSTGIGSFATEAFLCIMAVAFSFIDFAGFTDVIYPLFGFMGLVEMFCIFKCFLTHK